MLSHHGMPLSQTSILLDQQTFYLFFKELNLRYVKLQKEFENVPVSVIQSILGRKKWGQWLSEHVQ
jgi:hypothetical protein